MKERKREREQRNIFINRKKKNKLTEMKERQTVRTEGQTGRWRERDRRTADKETDEQTDRQSDSRQTDRGTDR